MGALQRGPSIWYVQDALSLFLARANFSRVRCGLTLFAIQAPSISKFCGLCGRQYLKEDVLLTTDDTEVSSVPIERDTSNSANEDVDMQDATDANNLHVQASTSTELVRPGSLLQLLFTACTACIYCGGKFVG